MSLVLLAISSKWLPDVLVSVYPHNELGMKVVEKSGMSVKSLIQKSYTFQKQQCSDREMKGVEGDAGNQK